jgi:ABC-type glutathione transport system ATPase component
MLSVDHLSVRYPGSDGWAIRDLSLQMAPGESLGLCGPSGCGKSTLARAILGLLPARCSVHGAVRFESENLLQAAPARLRQIRGRRIAILLQEPSLSLHPMLTIERQCRQLLRVHGSGEAPVRELAAHLLHADASRIWSRYPFELSGGERQRVALALALAHGPDLLIADEPTTALDSVAQRELLDLLSLIRSETGLAVLWISHDDAVLRYAAGRVLRMRQGVLAA